MTTTAGTIVITIGLVVMFAGFFSMNPIIIMFMFFAGIVTIIQGAKMKPLATTTTLPKPGTIRETTKTYTLTPRKDTKGPLSNVRSKGAV